MFHQYMIDQQVDVQVAQAILDKAKAEAAAWRLIPRLVARSQEAVKGA